MLYTELNNEIKKAAIKTEGVHTYTEGDIYLNWDVPNIKYGAVNLGLERADRTDNTIIYNTIIYYADRLLVDSSNKLAIWDDGVRIIQNILNMMSDDITYSLPITYTLFEQLFEDNLAGVYASIAFECSFEQGKCTIDDYIEELKTLYIDKNGNYDVIGYDKVNVDVQANLTYKLIEENGIFVPKGSDGFNVVEVNVPTRDGISEEECREIVEGYNYATEQWVEDKGYLTEHQDLSDYALKSEIPSLEGYATEQWIEDKGYLTEQDLPDLSNYVQKDGDTMTGGITFTESEDNLTPKGLYFNWPGTGNQGRLCAYKTSGGDNYLHMFTPTGVYAVLGSSNNPIMRAKNTGSGGVRVENHLYGAVTIGKDKSNICSLAVDGQNVATEKWVQDQGYLTEHQSLDGYATEEWVEDKGYLTEHQDLSNYATKDEIPSLDGYATEEWVADQGYLTEHQTLKTINGESIIGEGNIVIQGGSDDYLPLAGGEMKGNITFDANNTYKIGDSTNALSQVSANFVNSTLTALSLGVSGYGLLQVRRNGTTGNDGTLRKVKDTATMDLGLLDRPFNSIYGVDLYENGENINTIYAKKDEIPSLDGYATESWVNSQNYATKDELPDMDNYYSKVSNMDIKQNSLGHPSITLSANTGAKAVLGDGLLEIKDADGNSRAKVSQSGISWHDLSNSAKFTVGSTALHYGVIFEDGSYVMIELNPSGDIVKKTKTVDGVEKVEHYISESAFEYDEATQTLNINI